MLLLFCRGRKAAEVRREATALLDKAHREQDAASAAKTAAMADQAAADEAAAQQRREAAMLDSTRVRFEAECADRIQQLDAREDAVRRSEGMSQRLQEQERALQVSCCCYRRIHIAPHCPYAARTLSLTILNLGFPSLFYISVYHLSLIHI